MLDVAAIQCFDAISWVTLRAVILHSSSVGDLA